MATNGFQPGPLASGNDVVLGQKYRDKISGVEGLAHGVTQWITSCDTVGLHLGLKEDGTAKDLYWVDVTRLEPVGEPLPAVERKNTAPRGGPQPTPQHGRY